MQLTLPLTGSLDYADADWYLIGDRVVFEHLLFESSVGSTAAPAVSDDESSQMTKP